MYYGQLKNLSSRTSFSTRRTIRPREACKITAIFYGLLTLIFIILTFTCYIIKKHNIILFNTMVDPSFRLMSFESWPFRWRLHRLLQWRSHLLACPSKCPGLSSCPLSWVCVATRHHSCLAFVTCGDRIVASAVAQRGWGVSVVGGGMPECILWIVLTKRWGVSVGTHCRFLFFGFFGESFFSQVWPF